jgi:hypothetical protein
MDILKKILSSLSLATFGLILLLYGFSSDQNIYFNAGAIAIIGGSAVAMLSALDKLNGHLRTGLLSLIFVLSAWFAWADYMSIKRPLDFMKEKERRYARVIQSLKDVREIQLAYRGAYGKYLGSADSLYDFLKYDSLPVIKSFGTVPDTLTELEALERGILRRDTVYASASESVFSEKYTKERKFPFVLDSVIYVPFTRTKFVIEAAVIERGKVKVPVFQCTDGAPFDPYDVLKVGSLTEPNTSGNWGE